MEMWDFNYSMIVALLDTAANSELCEVISKPFLYGYTQNMS